MANLNKVMLIGRLTRDPEVRMFPNGGKVAKFGFAVNNRRRNSQTSQWEDEPVFLDIEAFNRGESGKQADLVEQYLHKGSQVFIEGHLQLDQWTAQDGQKRSKLKIVLDNMQFLEPRADGAGGPRSGGYQGGGGGYQGGGGQGGGGYQNRRSGPPQQSGPDDSFEPDPHPETHLDPPPPGRPEEDIPF